MRILITGNEGFIGSKLAKHFDNFIGIDTRSGQDLLTCELPLDIDIVYHLAAHASVEESWKDPVRNMQNLLTTVRLAETYPNAKIIYANSCAAADPASPYAFSKKCGADYLKKFHPNSVILIFPNIFGKGGRSVVDIFKERDEVTIFGDGLQIRDYVHVDDIVAGLLKAKSWDAGEYSLGSGVSMTVLDLAEGKIVNFALARKEQREAIVPNTTPNWEPIISVKEYLNGQEN